MAAILSRLVAVAAVTAVLLVGCSTVERAREAQSAVREKGAGTGGALAEPLDLRGYSLERLVDFALTNRPSIVASRLAVDDARLELRAIAADAPIVSDTPWTAPEVAVDGSYVERSRQATMRHQDFKTKKGDPSAALSLELLVWDFGRYDARAHAQGERIVAAEHKLADDGFAVFAEVAGSYLTYLENCALLDVALTNECEYADCLRRAEARFREGEVQKLDVLKARLDLASAAEAVVLASNRVDTSGAQLMSALGVEVSRGTCRDVLGPVPRGFSRVRAVFERTDDGLDELFAFARTNAPAMRVARAKLRAASADVDAAVADLGPRVSASVSFSWTNPFWVFSWGAQAVQSLFGGFGRVNAVDRAVVGMETAAAGVDSAEQELSLALAEAVANRDDAEKSQLTAAVSLARARENLELVQHQFGIGSVSRVEVSEALSSLSTAMGNCVTAFYKGQLAESRLFRLCGRYPAYREETTEVVP